MKLVVGLGNPGAKYEGTRHNIGFEVVQALTGAAGIRFTKKAFSSLSVKENYKGREVLFLLPQTYMNRSGEAVREAIAFYRISPKDLVVVHDDLDLALGRVKVDFNAGAAGHRGVGSITEMIGTKEFNRIRIGIGKPARKEEVEGYVLAPFGRDEGEVKRVMLNEAVRELDSWISKD